MIFADPMTVVRALLRATEFKRRYSGGHLPPYPMPPPATQPWTIAMPPTEQLAALTSELAAARAEIAELEQHIERLRVERGAADDEVARLRDVIKFPSLHPTWYL